jgi:hypothetical protein
MIGWRRAGHHVRRFAALLAAGLAVLSLLAPASAAQGLPAEPVTLTADHIEYNTQTGEVTAEGHVRVSRGDTVVTADRVAGNLQTGEVEATGAVTLTRAGRTLTAQALRYNFRTHAGRMEQVATRYGPWTLVSGTLEETPSGQGVATDTSLTPCDPRRPAFLVRAQRIVVIPGDRLTAYNAAIYVYGVHVLTVPSYTASLAPRRVQSGPRVGYDGFDGAWVEYGYYSPVQTPWGRADNQFRVRLGSRSGLSGEELLSERLGDHVADLHLGRMETFDQNGNLFTLDQYALDLVYDEHQLAAWPVFYALEAHAGSYTESQTAVSTTRGEAWLNMHTATFRLSPSVSWAASGQAREDVYGTGRQRSVLGSTIGVVGILSPSSLLTLTYNVAAVGGATPFAFDAISPDSTVALGYSYSGTGLLQSGGVSVSYSFLSQQTTVGLNVGLQVSPQVLLSASGSYNTTLQQWTEIDYAVGATCDCVSVGLLYRTFPQTPAANQFLVTVGLTAFPGARF